MWLPVWAPALSWAAAGRLDGGGGGGAHQQWARQAAVAPARAPRECAGPLGSPFCLGAEAGEATGGSKAPGWSFGKLSLLPLGWRRVLMMLQRRLTGEGSTAS